MSSRKYEIWITYNREREKIRLPVLPENIRIDNQSKNESVNISGLGEIIIKQDRPALIIAFSSFFPAATYPGIVRKLPKPKKCYNTLNKWKNGKSPVHLIITGSDVNMFCTIESFQREEKGGDPGTIYYNISLKEYRTTKARKVRVNATTKKAKISKSTVKYVAMKEYSTERVDNESNPNTYTIKKGDCLWNLAKKYYGDGSLYMKIYNANKGVIGGNPNTIRDGQVLTIP